MTEFKIARGWTLIGVNGFPVLDAATPQPEDSNREQPCVMLWAEDYDAMKQDLDALRKFEQETCLRDAIR